jgi:uncharacterized protein (TIGR02391 family)
LKWNTSLNEIGRAASSVFHFSCQNFPNESITSQRAKLIYDWLMTLGRQELTPSDRERLIADFCFALASDEQRPQIVKILTEAGVSQGIANQEAHEAFGSRSFHPEVVRHARKLFLQGNYFHAVFECAKAYNKQVKEKSQSTKDGASLMLEVWGWEKGVLKVTPCKTVTDRDVQDGIKFLSAGLMQAIRNPTAHEPAVEWPISRDDCLDILSFMSFLFRKLDQAVYFPS